ncbi:YTH domain-containing protein ECT3, partial [Cucurbita argyrosperma subsp. sororia]
MDRPDEDQDRIVPIGERSLRSDNLIEPQLSPKGGRIASANPSPNSAVIGPSRDAIEQKVSMDSGTSIGNVHPVNVYASSHEPNMQYGGYGGSSTGAWDAYSQYVNADSFPVVSPVMYNDSPSIVFHSGYGFNPDMAYGQYSPVATPMPSVMLDGQLYSPQQVPFSPSYYPQQAAPGLPHGSSAVPVSPTEMISPESSAFENMLYGPGTGFLLNFGSYGGGNLGSGSLSSPAAYPQPMGMFGSNDQNVGQASLQQRPMHGFGMVSSAYDARYPLSSSYQGSNFGGASISYPVVNDRSRLTFEKDRVRDRDRDSISLFNDPHSIFSDRNRGPRALKAKDFATDYETAKFFIIKSFSEDNVHRSIKYNVWASTPHGNKKLDAAYREAKEMQGNCPVLLFFSVNASGQFCGVAEMVGPVDFEKNADYWQQDRWSGQFPVKWHIIKDVPNIRFRHVLLQNNDNKPVTHSRDSQEVPLKQGIEMLKIFKDHDPRTSIIDDFDFYDERERILKERKTRQQLFANANSLNSLGDGAISPISDQFAQALQLDDNEKEKPEIEKSATSRIDASVSLDDDPAKIEYLAVRLDSPLIPSSI